MTPGRRFLRRFMRSKPNFFGAVFLTILAIILPTVLRWVLVGGYMGAPFVLYFPSVLIVSVLVGWRYAVFTAAGSGVVSAYMFWPTTFLVVGGQQVAIFAMYVVSASTSIAIGQLLRDALIEIDARARQSEDFNRELQHRTKNSIQMMRALASQASKATDPAEFYQTLGGRLAALAKANELLRFGALEACDMVELMRAAIAPFATSQITVSGPQCFVSRNGCTPLMMALHELATNASKYGALSQPGGRVTIEWSVPEGDGPVAISWRETGGPPVNEPSRRGIGARLLQANGDMRHVAIDYRPDGVMCELTVERC